MQLKLKRSQRSGGIMGGKVVFALDARVDLSADERGLVQKYALGKLSVYDSEARKKHAGAAYGHFDDAATTPGFSASSAGRSLWSGARGLASAAMMALSLRVTVDSLLSGQHSVSFLPSSSVLHRLVPHSRSLKSSLSSAISTNANGCETTRNSQPSSMNAGRRESPSFLPISARSRLRNPMF